MVLRRHILRGGDFDSQVDHLFSQPTKCPSQKAIAKSEAGDVVQHVVDGL